MLKFLKNNKTKDVLSIFLFAVFMSGIVSAQIPDKFNNLKVLPKDISKSELVATMKGFTSALGVRCYFCHVGTNERDLSTYDFASDEKTNKNKARLMMNMVSSINKDHLSKLSEYSDHIMEVKCITCHHGQNKPKLLEDILFRKINKNGIDSAITYYNKLKKEYFGGFTYNFQVGTLANLTDILIENKKIDDAITVSKLNVEMYPNSIFSLYSLGEAQEAKGNNKEAIEAYTNAMKIEPNNPQLKMKIEMLEKK